MHRRETALRALCSECYNYFTYFRSNLWIKIRILNFAAAPPHVRR